MNAVPKNTRMFVMTLVGFGISATLLWLLFDSFPIDFNRKESWCGTIEQRWGGIVLIVLSTALHCQLTAYKWRMVTRLTDPEADSGQRIFGYFSTLIALLGQVLPLQVAVLVGRSVVMKKYAQVPIRRSASGAVYDQFFDVLIPLVMVIPIVLVIPGWISFTTGMVLSFIFLIAVGGCILGFGERFVLGVLHAIAKVLPEKFSQRLNVRSILSGTSQIVQDDFMFKLYFWSSIRYLNLVFRAFLISWTLIMGIDFSVVLFSNSAVMFTVLLNFVPGALGVAEWGWVGMLTLAEIPAELAMRYAVWNRVLIVASLMVVAIVYTMIMALFSKQPDSNSEKED